MSLVVLSSTDPVEGALPVEVLPGRPHRHDLLHRGRGIVHRDAPLAVLRHGDQLGVHDELRDIERDARLEHPRPKITLAPASSAIIPVRVFSCPAWQSQTLEST